MIAYQRLQLAALSGAMLLAALALMAVLVGSPFKRSTWESIIPGLSKKNLVLVIGETNVHGFAVRDGSLSTAAITKILETYYSEFDARAWPGPPQTPLQVWPDELPINQFVFEQNLLSEAPRAAMSIYKWSTKERLWLGFLPGKTKHTRADAFYGLGQRIVGLPPEMDENQKMKVPDDLGALIASFALAQMITASNEKASASAVDSLQIAHARLSRVMEDPQYEKSPELLRAFGFVKYTIGIASTGNAEADTAWLQDAWNSYESALSGCDSSQHCEGVRYAQIEMDQGDVQIALGDRLTDHDALPQKIGRYRDAEQDFSNAMDRIDQSDIPLKTLLYDRLGTAETKLGQAILHLAKDQTEDQDSLRASASRVLEEASEHLTKAAQGWHKQSEMIYHHCAWARTQQHFNALWETKTQGASGHDKSEALMLAKETKLAAAQYADECGFEAQ